MLLLNYLHKHNFIDLEKKWQTKADILSWLTVALALIPEAIAFSFVAKVDPMVWLWAAFIMWLITAIFGWRPWMISGATWAMAVVMTSLVVMHWVEFLFAAIILAWVIQILFWVFKLWKLVRLIPHPVMLGFVNGLAIIIFMAQLGQFKVDGEWLSWTAMITMAILILLTMAVIQYLPKLTKSIPSWLVAIVFVSLLVAYFPWLGDVRTVASYLSENGFDALSWGFPTFQIPQIDISFMEMLKIILPYSVILAVIGLTESLMTLTLIDELTETRGKWNKESIGQWIANTICGFFWSMWWCAMIGQSMINISNGWRKRLSWISASIFLILFVVFGTSLIVQIPLAALVWLMFMVVIGTFAWPTLKMLNKIPKTDAFVMIAVTVITVVTWDLAIAVISWVIISALVFAWEKAEDISVIKSIDDKKRTHYDLEWPLFFGSITKFKDLFDIKHDTKEVIIDFAKSKVVDHSGIEAINNLTEKYQKAGKKLHLRHLSSDCKKLLDNAKKIVDVNIEEDPVYRVADDKLGG